MEQRISRKLLYRRIGWAVIVVLAFFAEAALQSAAQGRPQLKRPEETPQEKPPEPKKKKVKGPRAVGLLQLSGNGKATLVPIAILVEGKFYDASVYKAEPVPMALEAGTVYEVEREGDSQGLFTINGALHSKTAGSAHPWVGAGSYLPNGTEAAKATRKAEDVPVGIDSSGDEPPRLTRGSASKAADPSTPTATSTSNAPAGSPGAAPEKPGASASPTSSSPGSGASSGTSTGTSGSAASGQDGKMPAAPAASDKPADQGAKPEGQASPQSTSPAQASQSPTSQGPTAQGAATQGQEAESYYRPTLRRGKPTQPAPEEEPAKIGKPESAGAPAANPGPLQLVPAISDGGGPEPRSYKFFWKTGEEDERRKQMLELAADDVRAYVSALAKNRIPAKPAAKPATAHKVTAKPAQPVFENIRFRGFDVWGNNQPVMILSAEAHLPSAPGASAGPESYSVTLVAKTDIYGNLHKLYTGVTDKFHLDVTPQLELIDVVDADGDGRGELLFSETTDAGSGYVIYRATADKLWKMFDSLSAE
jgi:hypothetical protein